VESCDLESLGLLAIQFISFIVACAIELGSRLNVSASFKAKAYLEILVAPAT
jgi:hypothetical protein